MLQQLSSFQCILRLQPDSNVLSADAWRWRDACSSAIYQLSLDGWQLGTVAWLTCTALMEDSVLLLYMLSVFFSSN